jgi:hypothetical protein
LSPIDAKKLRLDRAIHHNGIPPPTEGIHSDGDSAENQVMRGEAVKKSNPGDFKIERRPCRISIKTESRRKMT